MSSALVLTVLSLVGAVFGDNRELVPLEAPTNLTLLELKNRQVLIEWDPVDPKSVRGSFRGYLVRTWSHVGSQVYVFPPDVTTASVEFFPFSKNFITVSARNEKYVGPPSEAISFDAPQIEPNAPSFLNVFPLSEKSVLLEWDKPTQPNGILVGYRIFCGEISEGVPEEQNKKTSHIINDPDKLQAKLTGLAEGMTYKFGISALNCAGESVITTGGASLESHTPTVPFPSKFIYKINYTLPNIEEICYKSSIAITTVNEEETSTKQGKEYDNYDYLIFNETQKTQIKTIDTKPKSSEIDYDKRCLVNLMVLWQPDVRNNPGEYFYLKYKLKGEKEYNVTQPETSEDFIILKNFDACKNYEIILTVVDGEYSTDSTPVITPTKI